MDGAIVLSADFKKILFANAQLIPDSSVSTSETGTRHRTAERTARQTGSLVISISQRRGIITIFKGNIRYVLEETSQVISKASQALQTVEKYKKVFDNKLSILNEYEFNDIVTLENVIIAVQRAEMAMRIIDEVRKAIYELGNEGRLVEMQLEELTGDMDKEELFIIKDYIAPGKKRTAEKVLDDIKNLSRDDLLKPDKIATALGYEDFDNYDEVGVYTRGYRILNKIPRMPSNIVDNLVKSFKSLINVLSAFAQFIVKSKLFLFLFVVFAKYRLSVPLEITNICKYLYKELSELKLSLLYLFIWLKASRIATPLFLSSTWISGKPFTRIVTS